MNPTPPRRDRRTIQSMRLRLVIVVIAATALGAGCTAAAPPTREARLGTLPDRGAVLYSWSSDGFLLSIESSAVRGRRPYQRTQMTQTDHRQVLHVAQDGRAVVINDYHEDGRQGTYVRWSSRGHIHTSRLLRIPVSAAEISLCGSRAVVYAAADGVVTRHLPGRARPISAPVRPALIECSPRGWIAALNGHGDLMIGSEDGLSTIDPGMRLTGLEWSPDGARLAACTEAGDLVLLSADGTLESTVARTGGPCEAAWSPDGRRLAFTRAGRLLVACSCGGKPHVVTADVGATSPVWSPAGTAIAYGELFAGVSAVVYSTRRTVVVAHDGFPLAWLDPSAARRASALADSYPCC
jgi:hypothetical protein